MTIDKTIAMILIIPIIGLVIPGTVFLRKPPSTGLSSSEKELIAFSSQPVSVLPPGQTVVFSGLECPIHPPVGACGSAKASPGSFPPGPIPSSGTAPAGEKNRPITPAPMPGVSMIYSDRQSKMAIIDGHVLHEGAAIGAGKVVKIEKTRVLFRTGGKDIWIHID